MNKKIKDLAIEAGLYTDLDGKPWPKWLGAEECEIAYEKFAELLIDACAKKVDGVRKQGGWYYGEIIRNDFDMIKK